MGSAQTPEDVSSDLSLDDAILNKSRQYKTIRKPLTPCHCSFAYSALASFRMGMSGSASFQRAVPYYLDSCRSTTSESECPRSMPSFFPSGDQWNESICSDVKFVIRWPAEPSSGCTQTLST